MSSYEGDELTLFADATRWKSYWGGRLREYVTGDVLDVGAGIGSTIAVLGNDHVNSWTALEPDPDLAKSIDSDQPPFQVHVVNGLLRDVQDSFDTVLYIDVLEHIADDQAELKLAAGRLNPGGYLVVLSPAHNWLMSPFDEAIGHYRRYDKRTLSDLSVPGCELRHLEYLDSIGMLASAANRLLLRQTNPTYGQIQFWDRVMVPLSRILDPLTGRYLGKTIVAVWQKTGTDV